MNEDFGPEYQNIIDRLRRVRRRRHLLGLLHWTLIAATAYLVTLLAFLAIEHVGRTGVPARLAMFWILHAGVIGLLLAASLPGALRLLGLRKGESDHETARRVGAHFPDIRDHLLNAMQLVDDASNRQKYSTDLIAAAFHDVLRRTSRIDFRAILNTAPLQRAAVLAGASAGIAILLFAVFPSPLAEAWERLRHYNESYTPFRLIVEPGNKELVKGDSVAITVRIEGTTGDPVQLHAMPDRQIEFEELPLERRSDSLFFHEVQSLGVSTTYYASSGPVRSEEYRLTVLDRPMVRMLRLTVTPPRYAGLAPYQPGDNVGDVTGLIGTRIRVEIEASKTLASASLVFDDGTEQSFSVDGLRSTAEMRLTRATGYRVRLIDHENLENRDPVRYSLALAADRAPTVHIEQPGINLDVAGNEHLPMMFRVSDDYGIGRLRLAWRLTQSHYEQPAAQDSYMEIPLPPGTTTSGYLPFTWALEGLNLVPEDVVTYYAEVFDKDNVSGPKVGRSESYTLRLPSLEEVFASLDEKHETGLEAMEEIKREVEEASNEAKKLEEELRKNQQKAGWEEQKKAEELAERYGEVQKKIEEATALAEEMVREMEKNRVVSPETLEKYKELQQLFEELNSEELREAMESLQESMRDMSPEEIMKAMEQFNITEEQIRKSIERTMNLLKRLQIEQKVDEAIRRMDEMMKQQAELQRQTEEMRDSDRRAEAEEAAREQEELSRKMEQLKSELQDLQGLMEQFPAEMPLSELDEALSQMDSTAMADAMKQISEQMKSMQMAEASSGQQQTMMSMEQVMEQLKAMQNMLQQNMQQAVLNEFRKAYQELLDLSAREEAMKNETGNLQRNSPLFREGLGQQMEAMKDLGSVADRLAAVAQKSFGVTPEMGSSIGEAMEQMGKAMESLESRNGQAAAARQESAMAALNEAAQQVQAGMNAMMQQGGQGMGMPGLMQQLQSMTGLQQGINQGTRHLGGMGQRQAAEMARLAGEQGAVRKSLEQLAREASRTGDLSKLLGDLSKIAQEMREVQTDLARGEVQPQTMQKQEQILSRLLDSQRSMRERDYEKKRKSETATGYNRDRLPGTDLSAEEAREKLRQDLLKALEQGYSRDYQSMIRSYFELLEQGQTPE